MSRESKTQSSDKWEVVVARNFEEIEAIRPVWEQMWRDGPYPVPNAHIDRYLSVVRTSGDGVQPYVMLVRDKGCPAAMIIGRIEKHQFKCKIGYRTICDPRLRCLSVIYGGILGQPSSAASAQIVELLHGILRRRIVDVVFLNQIRADSNLHEAMRKKRTGFLCRSHCQKFQQHWQTSIPYPWDGFRRMISRKHERDVHRCVRNLEKACSGPVKVVCYSQKEDISEFVKVSSRISALTYQRRMGQGFVADPLTLALLTQAQEYGWLRAYVLYAGSEPVVFEFGCVQGDGYFAETAGFDPRWKAYSPGTILQLRIFERLSRDDKVQTYDYGFGDATYKQRFGSVSWPEVSESLFAPAWYPITVNLVDSSIRGLSLGLQYLAQRFGLASTVKAWWRHHIQPDQAKCSEENISQDGGAESLPMSGKNDMRIRRANEADEVEILDICRRSFFDIRWRGLPARGRTWWAVALASEAADTYVAESDGRIVAFALLINNERLWKKENELRQGSSAIRVLSCVLCPRLSLAAVYRRINKLVNGTKEFPPQAAVTGSHGRTWLEMLVVRSRDRRRGIAQLLLQQCESRTKALGRDATALFVARTNEPAVRLYGKMGYEKSAQTYEYDLYMKTLSRVSMSTDASSAWKG